MKDTHEKRGMIWMPVVGMALFVVLVACAAVMYERNRTRFFRKTRTENVENPLFRQSDNGFDYVAPVMNGVDIANPRSDEKKLLSETKKMDGDFRVTVRKLNAHGEETEAENLSRRDAFAVRRLKILREIEKAESPEDRRKLIESLGSFSSK